MRTAVVSVLLCLWSISFPAQGADSDTGERINRKCALCHAMYGQGVPGDSSPRLAGLPAWYLAKATRDYQTGARKNDLMVAVSDLDNMSREEIEAVSDYLAAQDIGTDPAYNIRFENGDAEVGKRKYEEDCKTCHKKNGYGKKNKDAPPLAGQYPGYLLSSIHTFFRGDRNHDNDPIDDTFDDISDAEARDILAYLATLDDRRIKADYHFQPAPMTPPAATAEASSRAAGGAFRVVSDSQTVVMTDVDPAVDAEDAIKAMVAKAKSLNLSLQPVSSAALDEQEESSKSPMMKVLQFCSPSQAATLLKASPVLANYGPCRITLYRDEDENIRLMMVNLDMLVDGHQLPPAAQRIAILINQDMLAIMAAGARGGH